MPSEGNLTEAYLWTGEPSGATQRLARSLTHDDWGNVLTETDAKSNVTTHVYDATKHLFRTNTTNALNHTVQTVWATTCQAPSSQTDPNGLVTAFQYDLHCREVQRDLPNGQYLKTTYNFIGDPAQQYVETEEKSASTAPGFRQTLRPAIFRRAGAGLENHDLGRHERYQ